MTKNFENSFRLNSIYNGRPIGELVEENVAEAEEYDLDDLNMIEDDEQPMDDEVQEYEIA